MLIEDPDLVVASQADESAGRPASGGWAGVGAGAAEEPLWRRDADFQLLVESVSDYAIFGLDTEGRVTTWNIGAERIKGYRREEIVGKHFSVFYPEEEVRSGKPQVALQQAAKGRYVEEGWRIRKDGSRFWAYAAITALHDQAGNLRGFAKVTRDMTEQRQKEETSHQAQAELEMRVEGRTAELRRANESLEAEIADRREAEQAQHELLQRLRMLLDFSPVGCVMNDVNFRVTYWNAAAQRLFGFTQDEVLGKLPYETFLPESSRGMLDQVRQSVAQGEMVPPAISEHVTKGGRAIVCEWHNTPLKSPNGQFIGFLSMVQDITERKQAEERLKDYSVRLRALAGELQNAREAERAHVAREIHDELGQSLTALKMDLALLARKLPKNRAPLHTRVASMLKLIDDTIQTIRRIAAELRPSTLDDLGLSAAVEWQAQEFEARTGIQCRLSLPEDEIVHDSRRATALFRIFQEALTNVARHSGAKHVDVHLERSGDHVVLEMADDGKGLEGGQVASRTSLGLLGMRERAQLLGGEFSITTASGKGTTVTVRLPLLDRADRADLGSTPSDPHYGGSNGDPWSGGIG